MGEEELPAANSAVDNVVVSIAVATSSVGCLLSRGLWEREGTNLITCYWLSINYEKLANGFDVIFPTSLLALLSSKPGPWAELRPKTQNNAKIKAEFRRIFWPLFC